MSFEVSSFKKALPQIIAVNVKNVLLLVYGLTMGMPTILIPNLSGKKPGEDIVLDQDGISWIGSINYLCVPIGCLFSGALTQPIGRKRSMQVISLLFFAAFLLFHFSSKSWHVFLGLSLSGFSGGLLEAPTLIYVVEVTEPELRGALSSTSTVSIILGVMTSFLLGAFLPWRTMALVNATIPIVGLVLLILIPESPYWLITKNKLDEAKQNLAWLRGWTTVDRVEEEFSHMCSMLKEDELKKKHQDNKRFISLNGLKSFFKPTFLKPYALISFTFILAHFGTTAVTVFAIDIFTLLRVPISCYFATVLIGAVNLVGSLVCVFAVKYLGKRFLVFTSLSGICICFVFTGLYSYNLGALNFGDQNQISLEIAHVYNWVPLLTLTAMGFFSYLMTYTLPWILMGELYPNDVRDAASGFSAGTGYVIGFCVNKTFLNMVDLATLPGVMWVYSGVAVLGLILLYFWLPETEGKSLFEITEHYAGRGRLNNKVSKCKDVKEYGGVVNKGFYGNEMGD